MTVNVYSVHAARLEVRATPGGIVELEFSGPITISAMHRFGFISADATRGASGLLFLLGKAVLAFNDLEGLHKPATASHQRISGAMVVREDHLDMFDRYSDASARRGITRAVFVTSQAEQARRWLLAERYSCF